MKELKDLPTHVQLVQMGLPRLVTTIVLSSLTTNIWSAGLFHGWDGLTVGVTISFVVKSTSTLYLVALLDSILKNIGEALAVLVIYAWQVYPQLLCTTAPDGVIVTRETAGYYCD